MSTTTTGSVERRFRERCKVGDVLVTMSGSSHFVITELGVSGVRIDKIGPRITWQELEGAVPFLRGMGGVAKVVGGPNEPAPGSLAYYLRDAKPGPRKVSYLAPILVVAGVVEYSHVPGSRAKHVRLLPPFASGSGESGSYAEPPAPKDFALPGTPGVSAGRAHHTTEAEIRSDAGLVERAIRQTLVSGHTLLTPGIGDPPQRRIPFVVQIDDAGIRTDKTGNYIITWTELEGVVPYLNDRNGTAEIGAVRSTAKPDTLQSYLQQGGIRLSRASYVAAILEAARVVGYDHNNGKAKRIRLLPPFAPDRR